MAHVVVVGDPAERVAGPDLVTLRRLSETAARTRGNFELVREPDNPTGPGTCAEKADRDLPF